MRLSDFSFTTEPTVWAQFPSRFRDEAKLLVLHSRSGDIEHKYMPDLLSYFTAGDCLVLNDTKVMPCAFTCTKDRTNAQIHICLHRDLKDKQHKLWDALMIPARKVRVGNKIFFDNDPAIVGEIIDNVTSRGRLLKFQSDYGDDFLEHLFAIGEIPMPDYIERPLSDESLDAFHERFGDDLTETELDKDRMQSVFANPVHTESVLPSVGALNITEGLLTQLKLNDVSVAMIDCVNDLGMSEVVETEDLLKHKMPSGQVTVEMVGCRKIVMAHQARKYVIATGCEVLRGIEAMYDTIWKLERDNDFYQSSSATTWTNLFIKPPFQFRCVNALLSGFYEPYTPAIIAQFTMGGYTNTLRAYNEAIREGYHFGVYGDEFLILPD